MIAIMRVDRTGEVKNELRETLISAALDFARKASNLTGVRRIAVIGSIMTDKLCPKDIDLLVTIEATVDLARLAKLGRKLKGRTQGINAGADIFLLNAPGSYIGRICRFKECPSPTRTSCKAGHCGQVPHLCDDLGEVDLNELPTLLLEPPLIIFPQVAINTPLPPDLLRLLNLWSHSQAGDQSVSKNRRADSSVLLRSSMECSAEIKHASNCDGGR